MRSIAIASFAVLACAQLQLPAQIDNARERVEREVEEKKRLMREGKVIRTNVRVTVRLRNGSRLRGVVRNGRFIERVDGLSFVPSDLSALGSGLRLWYYNQTNSYIFLPYGSILAHEIGERLTSEEVREIARRLEELEQEGRERAERIRNERNAAKDKDKDDKRGGDDGDGPAGRGARRRTPPDAADSPLTPEQKALLAEFPPEAGWGKDRMEEIEARKIRVGVFPDEKSKRFLEVFAEWNEAYETLRSVPTEVEPPAPKPGPKPGSKPPSRVYGR